MRARRLNLCTALSMFPYVLSMADYSLQCDTSAVTLREKHNFDLLKLLRMV